MAKKEQLKLRKEIKKVKCIFASKSYLTEDKIYEVYGIYLEKFSDRSEGLNYLIKGDDNQLHDCCISWFEIVD